MISVSSTAVGGSGVLPPTTSAAPNNSATGSVAPGFGNGGSLLPPTASAAPDPDSSATPDTTIAGQISKTTQGQQGAKAPLATDQQVADLQSKMAKLNPELTFVLEKGSGRAVIQLMDRTTKEVIQQFPSEAAMQISKELDRYANGKLVNKVA